jgi:uncharacterized protein (DUF1015 family)
MPLTLPLVRPFAALRPTPERAPDVAARPYDVVSFAEAKASAAGRPWSFLHVSRAEIDLPENIDAHSADVYAQAARSLAGMIAAGVLIHEASPCFYAYRMTVGDHVQTGIAAAGSVAAYRENRIRRHEHTRPDKELDRTRQIEAVGAHTGPVLTVHAPDAELAQRLAAATSEPAIADAHTEDGTRHQVWRIAGDKAIDAIGRRFAAMPAIWIADGHHRSAAAARVAAAQGMADARFLLVSFPTDAVRILDYNRVVRDLNGHGEDGFLAAVGERFAVTTATAAFHPERPGVFGMRLGDRWYRLEMRDLPSPGASPVERLDVSLLNDRLLAPVLGIADPRTDPRIEFVGGGRGLSALEERVAGGSGAVAFALHPTRLEDLIAVADAGLVMPPKSTWFEPKLADGLLSLPLGSAGRDGQAG